MSQTSLLERDIEAYLKEHENKELLRFITCGSVDDGKSTLIGRLLHDTKAIYEDQLATLAKDSQKSGTTGAAPDLALLVDGLQSEREQGITIDVAYRYFSTDVRKFIIADTPGHEQYTRNMATGASTADLAIILIDARHGVQVQTRRHSFIVGLLGIRHIVVAINKIDLVAYSEERFVQIEQEYRAFARQIGLGDVHCIPVSALNGDNIVTPSEHTPWYSGATVLQTLEKVDIASDRNLADFRFPVQYVNRPNLNFRGFAGTIASGRIQVGDAVTVLPSRKTSRVQSIVTYDGELSEATAQMAVTLTLEDEIDISRGNMIVRSDTIPETTDHLEVDLVWMHDAVMEPGKSYIIKRATTVTTGMFSQLAYRQDVNTLEKVPAQRLALNEIGRAGLILTQPIACDPYSRNRLTGSFIVIDRLTNNTVGAGMIVGKLAEHAKPQFSPFEIELNALIRRHFPHWQARDILMGGDYSI
nr:sulfate adenylyltransferase subunit CysN [Chrysiogenes arsenatis]